MWLLPVCDFNCTSHRCWKQHWGFIRPDKDVKPCCAVFWVFTFSTDKKKSSKVCLQIFSFLWYCHCGFMPTPVSSTTVSSTTVSSTPLSFHLFNVFTSIRSSKSYPTQFNVQFNVLWNIYHVPINPRKAKPLILGISYIWHMMSVNVPWRNTPKTSTKACKTLVNLNLLTMLQNEANVLSRRNNSRQNWSRQNWSRQNSSRRTRMLPHCGRPDSLDEMIQCDACDVAIVSFSVCTH